MRVFSYTIFFISVFLINSAHAQSLNKINSAMKLLTEKALLNTEQTLSAQKTSNENDFKSGALQLMNKHYENIKNSIQINKHDQTLSNDTLWIGKVSNDTLLINDTSTIKKTIFVVGDGVLIIRNAHLTVVGDLLAWGENAKVVIENSYLYFPQEYFYQRTILAVWHANIKITNTTLDYSGLSHNLALMDSASIEMNNVHLNGFTTCGLWGNPLLKIDGTNQAGEFIMTSSAKLEFKNAHTILLWHKLDSISELNISFPKGDTVASYILNKQSPGVKGINFDVKVENSTDIMWGLMPDNKSKAVISNSTIRTIGLWFTGSDSTFVSGLVNNSDYKDFEAPLTDRTLHLINSKVQTWSLYPMEKTKLNITGCILGEVGAGTRSNIFAQNIFVDGTGGYYWSSDTSFVVSGFSSFTTSVRSEKYSIMLLGYSSVTNGIATAIGNSVLIVTQCSLPEPPKALEGGVVWFLNIEQPSTAYTDKIVPIKGSAWLEKGPQSKLMDFSYYRLYYKRQEDSLWNQIGSYFRKEVHSDTLGLWDTHGLPPGAYQLRLVITDNTADSNDADAVKGVNLLPVFMSAENNIANKFDFQVFPNPATATFSLEMCLYDCNNVEIKLFDEFGKDIETLFDGELKSGTNFLTITDAQLANLSSGTYYLRLKNCGETITKPIIILK